MVQLAPFMAGFVLILGAGAQANAQIMMAQGPLSSAPIGVTSNQITGPTYNFSYNDAVLGTVGMGTLTTVDSGFGDGSLLAVGGSITVNGGVDPGTYPLYPGGPGLSFSPNGMFTFDDLVYPNGNAPLTSAFLSPNGLLFVGFGTQVNIFAGTDGGYSFYGESNGVKQNLSPSWGGFQLASAPIPAPEPASMVVLFTGCASLAGYVYRRTRNTMKAAPSVSNC